jgi:hypothetical protein
MKLGIVSGFYPGFRVESAINHKAYADKHGYHYIYNFTPERDPRYIFYKIETLLRYIDLFDWVFWIDDDAYFTNFSIPLASFLDLAGDAQMLICKSPSTKKVITKYSSGQFFLKSSPQAKDFLRAALAVNLEKVKAFWREDLGLFTNGDQDAIVYLSEVDPRYNSGFIKSVDHNQFNNRDFEYEKDLSEHFLVHFTGAEKQKYLTAFAKRLNVNRWLLPKEAMSFHFLGAQADGGHA